jgi:hypothetical protein
VEAAFVCCSVRYTQREQDRELNPQCVRTIYQGVQVCLPSWAWQSQAKLQRRVKRDLSPIAPILPLLRLSWLPPLCCVMTSIPSVSRGIHLRPALV